MSLKKTKGCDNLLIFIQTNTFARKWITNLLISPTTLFLNEGQGHPTWYQNIEISGLYYDIKFERNQPENVWIQANVKVFLTNKTS